MHSQSIIDHIKSLVEELQNTDLENVSILKSKVLFLYDQLVLLEQSNTQEAKLETKQAIETVESNVYVPTLAPEPTKNLMVDEAVLKTGIEEFPIDAITIEENIAEYVEEKEVLPEPFEDITEEVPEGPELLHELESITEGFELPEFEPAPTLNSIQEQPKSLNELLNKSVQIGLNDRIAFINHLFEGKQEDYTRVISQINTIENADEVTTFIDSFVKPEYHNWEGKEAIEERFIQVVLKRFEA